jgi:hypothetical protein
MLVVLFNAVKVESVPLNFNRFRQHTAHGYRLARSTWLTLDRCAIWALAIAAALMVLSVAPAAANHAQRDRARTGSSNYP